VNGNGTIGALALYLLFAWLISAAGAAWLTERKGYGERAGLMLGLLLTAAGLLVALLLPPRSGSKWRSEGWRPRRKRRMNTQEEAGQPDRLGRSGWRS
jgi:hypothetical protein